MHTLKLIRPTQEYADQVRAYRQEMLDNGDSLDGCAALEDTNSYAEWADFEGRLRERYGEGYVPSDVYLAVRKSDDRLVGMIDFRRPLTEFLLRFGGNIGYSVDGVEGLLIGFRNNEGHGRLGVAAVDGGRLPHVCVGQADNAGHNFGRIHLVSHNYSSPL